MNKILYKDYPSLFVDIEEYAIETESDHRRGSSFYTTHIIEFKKENKEDYPDIENFDELIGFWKTNTYIRDTEYGTEEAPSVLKRVNKIEKVITTVEWQEV